MQRAEMMIRETTSYIEEYLNGLFNNFSINNGLLYQAAIVVQDWLESCGAFGHEFLVYFDIDNYQLRVKL